MLMNKLIHTFENILPRVSPEKNDTNLQINFQRPLFRYKED